MKLPRSVASRAAGATTLLACLAGCGPAPITAVSVVHGSLAGGLVAHWAFDVQSTTTVMDTSGNAHDGQLMGGTWVEGRFKGGLHLQPGDIVTIPSFPQATADWTVSVWIKLSATDLAAFIDKPERAVLLTAERASMGGWELEFDPRAGFDWLEASYYVAPFNDYVVLDCKCIETDRWMHFAAVFDTTGNHFSLYHDGILTDSSAMPAPILPGATDLSIGTWEKGNRPLAGVIDDYAIWSRALTPDEIAAVYTQAVPNPP